MLVVSFVALVASYLLPHHSSLVTREYLEELKTQDESFLVTERDRLILGSWDDLSKVTIDLRFEENSEDEEKYLHIEAFYQYRIHDNIAVTPGVIWITAPDNNSDNDDPIIVTIRTTFTLYGFSY